MSDELKECPTCSEKLTAQGYCRTTTCTGYPLGKIKPKRTPQASSEDSNLVRAVDRTTYAIRSLAIFLFTTLCTSLLGYGLIGAGATAALRCNSYYSDCGSGFVIWGWVIIALGFIIGLGVGITELGKSKP